VTQESPRDRLEAKGYTLDGDATVELGHDGHLGRRRRRPDPRFFGPTAGPAALEVRCGVGKTGQKSCSRLLATLWPHEGDYWIEARELIAGNSVHARLDEVTRPEDESTAVRCPVHGVARISATVLRAAAASPRRFVLIDVTAGFIG
jgi:hypothetical protein